MSTLLPKITVKGQTVQTGERPQTNGRTHECYQTYYRPAMQSITISVYDCWRKCDFSFWQNIVSYEENWTSSGRLFQSCSSAAENEWWDVKKRQKIHKIWLNIPIAVATTSQSCTISWFPSFTNHHSVRRMQLTWTKGRSPHCHSRCTELLRVAQMEFRWLSAHEHDTISYLRCTSPAPGHL